MKVGKYIAFLFLMLDSCIDPFNISVQTQNAFVVDGLITDQPGPQTVKIFMTSALGDQLNAINWVQGALFRSLMNWAPKQH